MPRLIAKPTVVTAAGNKPKRIEEFAGRVSSGHENVSIARMVSPGGWQEPAQQPQLPGHRCCWLARASLRKRS